MSARWDRGTDADCAAACGTRWLDWLASRLGGRFNEAQPGALAAVLLLWRAGSLVGDTKRQRAAFLAEALYFMADDWTLSVQDLPDSKERSYRPDAHAFLVEASHRLRVSLKLFSEESYETLLLQLHEKVKFHETNPSQILTPLTLLQSALCVSLSKVGHAAQADEKYDILDRAWVLIDKAFMEKSDFD
ncbi:MAG: hypothetical protein MHM6MM_009582, partial [Cercozoa sp. M6MM]